MTISVTKSDLSLFWTSNDHSHHPQNDEHSLCGDYEHYLFIQNIANSLDTFGTIVHPNKHTDNSLDIEISICLMVGTFATFGTMFQPNDLNHHTLFLEIRFELRLRFYLRSYLGLWLRLD